MSVNVASIRSLLEQERRNSMTHYIYFAGGSPPDGVLAMSDRKLWDRNLQRGKLTAYNDLEYEVPNQTAAALEKENDDDIPPTMLWLKHASAQADELENAYGERGLIVVTPLMGKSQAIADAIEQIIMPVIPPTLIQLGRELDGPARARVQAINDKEVRDLAGAVLAEFIRSAEQGFFYQSEYLDIIEAERIERTKPGGLGKTKLDRADLYYYTQLERKVPTLETVPVKGGLTKPTEAAAVAVAPVIETKNCPECDEPIRTAAMKCKWCGYRYEEIAEEKKAEYLDLVEPKKQQANKKFFGRETKVE